MKRKRTILLEQWREALTSVLPIAAIVFVLCFTIVPVPNGVLAAYVVGALLLIAGMGLFTLGADLAMMPIGQYVGSETTKTKRFWLILLMCFLVGSMITMSEPDLQVLAEQVPSISNGVIVGAVSVGVGAFLVVAMLRILFRIKLSYLLIGLYAVVFILAIFVPSDFLPVAFDSGGVTTGPMTVPFIMAFGMGIAATRSDENSNADSFGLVALCSVGPILAVMVLGLVYQSGGTYTPITVPDTADSLQMWQLFQNAFPTYLKDVGVSLLPIALFFIVFQIIRRKMHKAQVIRVCMGLLYTYVGLVLFLTGVNVGFMPVGYYLGEALAGLDYRWIIIPIGMLMGYFIVTAEPAVHVLNKQVYELTSGVIPKRAMRLSLAIGVSVSVGLSMLRILTGLPILYLLVPGYLLALVLSFFVPPVFTAIAFDSGGVASGPMTATFLLPFAMGACTAVGGNVITDAFGVVAMVAMTPLLTIQVLGLCFRFKSRRLEQTADEPVVQPPAAENETEEIIEL